MHVDNNIDFLLAREDLLQVFNELVPQLNNNNGKVKILFNIIENINKNNFIVILDNISLDKLIKDKTILNNYLFIIGEISIDIVSHLSINYINYEIINEPINILLLQEKLKNLIDQKNSALSEIKKYKKFNYSSRLKTIYVGEISLYLTDKENEIFQILLDNKNVSLSKKQLLSKVWNYNEGIDTHTLETHIYTLRQKIGKKLNLNNIIQHADEGYQINTNT
ncbi:winged helix-turn-helix domain-containing protein [Pelagibacterales bacterium]|nr:winged helix-turn-helix domain-containing protein [Pelagibacterales bacterium]